MLGMLVLTGGPAGSVVDADMVKDATTELQMTVCFNAKSSRRHNGSACSTELVLEGCDARKYSSRRAGFHIIYVWQYLSASGETRRQLPT